MLARAYLVAAILLFIVANVFVFRNIYAPPRLTVSFLSVGNGDAVLVRSPNGTTLLIDSGPDASVLRELGATLPFWRRRIDAVIEMEGNTDTIGGLPDVFARYQIQNFITTGTNTETGAASAVTSALASEKGVQKITGHRGTRLTLGGGAYADVLYPAHTGNSLALRVVYGNTSFLFSGDLSSSERKLLIDLDGSTGELKTNVLAVPHEGASNSVDEAWLTKVQPDSAVISVGKENRYGYPATSTIAALKKVDAHILRTDLDGRITFESDGATVTRK